MTHGDRDLSLEGGISRRRLIQVGSTAAVVAGAGPWAAEGAHAATGPGPADGTGADPSERKAGIWYSTWYNLTTSFDWRKGGPGKESDFQLVGDVDGDGRDDAVVVKDGRWYVALSDGTRFVEYDLWLDGFGRDATEVFLADVDGDGRLDAVAFNARGGTWWVALSEGDRFGAPAPWLDRFGNPTEKALLADVDGDGRADAVTFDERIGTWSVALSTGARFDEPSVWLRDFGVPASSTAMLADVDGDGRADAVLYDATTSDWSVARSDGQSFVDAHVWIYGFGVGSVAQLCGDMTGDGRSEAVALFADGRWWRARSDGVAFENLRKVEHIRQGFGVGSSRQFVGNTYGRKDKTLSLITFTPDEGWWQVQGINNYKLKNRWEAWPQQTFRVPEVAPGVFRQYDSGDPDVIDYHLTQLTDAGFDFLVFDETNGLHTDQNTILARAKAIARRINHWNSSGRKPIRYAIAVGGPLNRTHDPQKFEDEADEVWKLFVDDPEMGGDNYMRIDGKPLIVLYTWHLLRSTWVAYPDHASTDRFTVKFASGWHYKGDYGWYNPETGPVPDSGAMFITPRKATLEDRFSAKSPEYYAQAWESVLAAKPDVVVAGAHAAYAEMNEVSPVDTSGLPEADQWINPRTGKVDPYLYWRITTESLAKFKS